MVPAKVCQVDYADYVYEIMPDSLPALRGKNRC